MNAKNVRLTGHPQGGLRMNRQSTALLCILALSSALPACGGSSSNSGGGGSGGAGGSTGSGGNNSGTGGSSSGTGGTNNSGTGGSGGGAGNGTFSTGLPPNQSLGGLSDADGQKFCDSLNTFYSSNPVFKDFACKSSSYLAAVLLVGFGVAMTDEEAQKTCSDAFDKCASGIADGGTSTCKKPSSQCMATTTEFEACVNDSIGVIQGATAGIPACSSITVASLKSDAGSPFPMTQDPTSCDVVKTKCPELNMMSSTSSPPGGQ
jgi:hypothetical protein